MDRNREYPRHKHSKERRRSRSKDKERRSNRGSDRHDKHRKDHYHKKSKKDSRSHNSSSTKRRHHKSESSTSDTSDEYRRRASNYEKRNKIATESSNGRPKEDKNSSKLTSLINQVKMPSNSEEQLRESTSAHKIDKKIEQSISIKSGTKPPIEIVIRSTTTKLLTTNKTEQIPSHFLSQSNSWLDASTSNNGFGFPFQLVPPPPPPPPPPSLNVEPPPPPPPPPLCDCATAESQILTPKTEDYIPEPVPPPKELIVRPIVLKPRDLPTISEGWGIGNADKYKIIEQVGEGTYGQVYKASDDKLNTLVALKKIRLENEKEGFPITAVREIKILRQLDHPNIVKLLDIVTDRSAPGSAEQSPVQNSPGINIMKNRLNFCNLPNKVASSFYLVFEYVDHDLMGLLDSQLVILEPLQAASLMKQLLLALTYCHMRGFLHRDLKCSNILISKSGRLKLADFGLARLYQENNKRLYTNRVITLWYRPPELLLGEERYGPWVDIWSAGCILAELFTKKPIFQGANEINQLDLITSSCGSITPEVWPGVVELPLYHTLRPRVHHVRRLREKFAQLPSQALDLLDILLQLDPMRRPDASKALNHPWLNNVEPELVPPLNLPVDQDYHEMNAKKRRRSEHAQQNTKSIHQERR